MPTYSEYSRRLRHDARTPSFPSPDGRCCRGARRCRAWCEPNPIQPGRCMWSSPLRPEALRTFSAASSATDFRKASANRIFFFWPTVHRRKSRRRRGHRGCGDGSAGAGRRLHTSGLRLRRCRDGDPVRQAQLQFSARSCTGRRHRAQPPCAGGESVVSHQDNSGIHRLRQGQPAQDQLRLGGRRLDRPYGRRAV